MILLNVHQDKESSRVATKKLRSIFCFVLCGENKKKKKKKEIKKKKKRKKKKGK